MPAQDTGIRRVDLKEEVVARNQLVERVWPKELIELGNISQHIWLLRYGLSSNAKLIGYSRLTSWR